MASNKLLLMLIIFLLALFAHTANSSSADELVQVPHQNYMAVLSDVLRIFTLNQKCLSRGFFECIQLKFLRAIDRIVKTTDVLEVTSGVYFVKNPDIMVHNRSDLRALQDARIGVRSFLMEKLREFLQTHLLQISFPTGRSLDRVGRKKPFGKLKLGKGGAAGLFFALALSGVLSAAFNISLMMGTVVMPIVIGGIALIAIIVAKIAFVFAGVAGVKTIMSDDDRPEKVKIITKEMPIDWNGNPLGKQLQGKESSQNLVYSSYVPEGVMQSGYQYYHQH